MRKLVAVLCAIGAFAAVLTDPATAADPLTLPLLQFSDFTYVGGFRLPRDIASGTLSMGGLAMTYNPGRNSLFVGNRKEMITEVAIPPDPVNSSNPEAMPFGTFLQDFADPTEGHLNQIAATGVSIQGLLVQNDKLHGTGAIYYDADGVQKLSHYSRSPNLLERSFVGMTSVWDPSKAGFVAGYMASVPSEWQGLLGGPAITGQCCLPITWRTSWGPSAFVFNPANIGVVSPVPASPLLYYSSDHQTLGPWMGSNEVYGGNVEMGGVALIAGTRTAVYIGRNALGPFCYGEGTANPSLVGTMSAEGAVYCYDPTNPHKGQHGYPYRYQMWAYDLAEFVKVRAGQKAPWDVRPYGVWPLDFPAKEPTHKIGGIGYDAARQLIYISQMHADKDGYSDRPIVQMLKANAPTSAPPISTSPLPPPPVTPPSTRVASVTMVANKPAPQPAGTSITFTAAPSGGVAPVQYKWFVYDNVRWSAVTGWSTSQNYAWTPATANAGYKVGVWVKNSTNPNDELEATFAVDFPIGSGTAPAPAPPPSSSSAAVTAVSIVANRVAPQVAGTATTFTAAATGGASPQQFKWWVFDGITWSTVTGWTTMNTFTWTPGAANPNYRVGVWARSGATATDTREASAEFPFPITASTSSPAPAPAPAPVPSTTPAVTSLLLSSDKPAPQPRGTTVVFTATASGGVAPLQFKWFVDNGYGWLAKTGWTTTNTFVFSPGDENPLYRVGVWVKSATNTAEYREQSAEMAFPTTKPVLTAPSATTTSSKATSVALTADRSGTGIGVPVTFTAAPTGGAAPHQYKWFVYNGTGWAAVTGWSTTNSYTWAPASINANYRVGVWVRSAGATADALEASQEYAYPVK
jgi:hypothetical protein